MIERAEILARLTRAVEAYTDGEVSLCVQIVEDLRRQLEEDANDDGWGSLA